VVPVDLYFIAKLLIVLPHFVGGGVRGRGISPSPCLTLTLSSKGRGNSHQGG
jgi:hypothetical protein